MQVNKINCTNTFSGLWQNTDKTVGKVKRFGADIVERQAIYRPFKNESQEEIEKTLAKVKEQPVWECDDDRVNDPYGPDHYIVTKPQLGEKLNITADEYDEIMNLEESGTPKSNYPLYYSQTKSIPDEVKEVM